MRHDYQDALEVTNVEDMADYVYSLTGMSGLREVPRETLVEVLRENMVDGVLRVPKEYGMFECGVLSSIILVTSSCNCLCSNYTTL